ncbi:short-chain dehydrogenase [Solitalea longa]|uniref:Short-chain dehydrogenase n=1 Tax=Solitalea longa TaxID=2079460 RepID=A0A2S5A1D8_9SPHI|nr:pirin family protein [Solitalea longa]POY36408.1 short-chain dehydrogenase [Solitalea longa]
MATKQIKQVLSGASPHMVGDGFRVSNYIPGPANIAQQTNPFIMLDYNMPYNFPPSDYRRGVGEHPHRGFETVSIAYEGQIEHRDSSGGGGVISADDVQWMTAASGLMHDEFQSQAFAEKGGIQHFIQIWVNLPAKDKMSPPKYQAITNENISVYKIDDKGSVNRIIAGNFKGIQGAASTFTPIEMYDLRMVAGAEVSFDIPASNNTMILVTKGSFTINDEQKAGHKDFVLFKHEGETIKLKADEDSYAMVLSGEPINEPIVSYGPFVMNTKEEIVQAIDDFNAGKFGSIQ